MKKFSLNKALLQAKTVPYVEIRGVKVAPYVVPSAWLKHRCLSSQERSDGSCTPYVPIAPLPRGARCGACGVRGQSPSSMGESFFFPCTRHVSMYLRHGIVIHSFCLSFILSHGVIFFISVLRHYPRFVHPCY